MQGGIEEIIGNICRQRSQVFTRPTEHPGRAATDWCKIGGPIVEKIVLQSPEGVVGTEGALNTQKKSPCSKTERTMGARLKRKNDRPPPSYGSNEAAARKEGCREASKKARGGRGNQKGVRLGQER